MTDGLTLCTVPPVTCTFSTLSSKSILWVHIHGVAAQHFWFICLLGRAIAGLSYGQFIAIRCKFKLPTYIQEPLVTGGGVTYREI